MGFGGLKNLANALLTGGANFKIGGFTVDLPSLNIFNSNIESPSIGNFIDSAGSIIQTLTKGGRAIMCIGSLLVNPDQMLKALTLSLDYLKAFGLQFLNDIYKTFAARINNTLSTVFGIATGYFNTIKNVISAIYSIGDLISDLFKFFTGRSDEKLDLMFKNDDCAYFIANITRCLLSKLLTPIVTEARENVNQVINDVGGSINNTIINSTDGITLMANYLNQQSLFVKKFTNQVNDIL